MTLQPGSRIGLYEVRELIGAGGMGEVYRAHDLRLGRDVALKTLPAELVADSERVARFEREARILATLSHPNVAAVYGLEQQGDVLALVMELVEGETLEQRMDRAARDGRPMATATALEIARQLVAALDAAHEKGIVHRDLKPANVKFTADDVVKVLDFGIAKFVEPAGAATAQGAPTLTRLAHGPGAILGTPAYMSPEQARGQAIDRRTDVWAFGCILYEMLAGRPLFGGSTAADTLAAVVSAPIGFGALPADVPVRLRRLLARCLERNPKNRLRDIADARLFVEDDAVDAEPLAAAARGAISRRTALFGGAALGVIGAGLGAAVVGRRARSLAPTASVPSFHRLTFRRGMIRTVRFGPDYQTVLYGALWDGDVARVYTVRPEGPESTALPLPPAVPLAVSSSGELALALGTHFRGIMTYGTLARAPVAGGAPRELEENVKYADWSPDGQQLAIVRSLGDGDQLEFPMGQVIAEPTTAGAGYSFARVSPRGDAVAAFELDSAYGLIGRVVVVDRSGKKRATSETYFNVFGLAWGGGEIWFSAADERPLFRNTVYAMSESGEVRVVARMPGNVSLHDIAPDGRVLIARTDDRSGIAVRAPGELVAREMSWLDSPGLADITRDGRQILFSETGVGGGPRASTYLRGTDGSLAVRLADGYARALSPDGRWALVRQSDAPHLDLVPTGPGQVSRLARSGLVMHRARWLPDGPRVVVSASPEQGGSRGLYLIDIDGTSTQPITPADYEFDGSFRVSPDAALVAVSTEQGVDLLPVAGGPPRRVPGSSERTQVVGWVDDGLLLSDDPDASGILRRVDPVTGRGQTWADIRPTDPAGIMSMDLRQLAVTPDGRAYGYGWHRAISDLYLVEGWA